MTPRYVQLVARDAAGHLPTLYCPRDHPVRTRVRSFSEYGFLCDHTIGDQARCEIQLWLIVLSPDMYALLEITREEYRAMERERMDRERQLAYLWRRSPVRLVEQAPRRIARLGTDP